MTAYNDENENLMADRQPDLDQKGLDAAQAYISERMEGTGLAPLFATPIIRAYFAALPPSPTANVKWYLCDGTQPVAISVIAAYFDDILGEWVCDVIDPPFSWNEHAYLGQYTYWTPLSAILPPTGFPRNP